MTQKSKIKRAFKIQKWLKGHLPILSVSDPRAILKIMNGTDITYMGEHLKVEIALMERLEAAGQLKDRRDTTNYHNKVSRAQ